MKISIREIEKQAPDALRACLDGVPFLKVKQSVSEKKGSGATPDMIVEIEGPQGKQLVLLEVKTNGEPRFAREAVNQLLRFRQSYPDAYGVFVAPYITPRAAEICTSEGIGYVDLSGNCRLCFGTTFIQQEGRPNKFAEKRDLRTLYSPKATRILRVLLNEPKRVWKITELSQEAEVSLGLVSNVKRLLENREWIGLSRSGFSLSQPEELLAEWKDNYNFHGNEFRDYYSLKKPTQIEADLANICSSQRIRYALTSFSAAARLAPFVPYQRVFAFIEDRMKAIASELQLKEVESGANVTLLLPYDKGVFYGTQEFEGIRTASPIQAYLDLIGFRGRGEEAANMILQEVVKPGW